MPLTIRHVNEDEAPKPAATVKRRANRQLMPAGDKPGGAVSAENAREGAKGSTMNPTLMRMVSLVHVFWYQSTGGLIGGSFLGRPMLLLTTTGRQSGRSHTTPLLYVSDGDDVVLAASNGGNRPASRLVAEPPGEPRGGGSDRVKEEESHGGTGGRQRARPPVETTCQNVQRFPELRDDGSAGDPRGSTATEG